MESMDNKVNLAVISQEFLQKLESDINELKVLMRTKNEEEISSQWIESTKVPKILGISRKTWWTYRDKRLIPFSQIGSKIYIKREDLETFMKDHYITAKR